MPGSARERLVAEYAPTGKNGELVDPEFSVDLDAVEAEAVAAERARIKSRAEAYWAADFITEEEWDRVCRFIGEEPL